MVKVTQVIYCSLCYHTASGTRAPSLGPKGSLTALTQWPPVLFAFVFNTAATHCLLSMQSLYPYLHVQITLTNLYPCTLIRYMYPLYIALLFPPGQKKHLRENAIH